MIRCRGVFTVANLTALASIGVGYNLLMRAEHIAFRHSEPINEPSDRVLVILEAAIREDVIYLDPVLSQLTRNENRRRIQTSLRPHTVRISAFHSSTLSFSRNRRQGC
jgi:hypothetical protein